MRERSPHFASAHVAQSMPNCWTSPFSCSTLHHHASCSKGSMSLNDTLCGVAEQYQMIHSCVNNPGLRGLAHYKTAFNVSFKVLQTNLPFCVCAFKLKTPTSIFFLSAKPGIVLSRKPFLLLAKLGISKENAVLLVQQKSCQNF